LNQGRTDAAGASDDQQRLVLVRVRPHPVEQQLPRRQGRQRQGRRLGEVQRPRLRTDDPFVHRLPLGIRSGAVDLSGVEHLVADLEQADLWTDRGHDTRRVIAQDVRRPVARRTAEPHLEIDRVQPDALDLDQQVTGAQLGLRGVDGDKGGRVGDGARTGGYDGFHAVTPLRVPLS